MSKRICLSLLVAALMVCLAPRPALAQSLGGDAYMYAIPDYGQAALYGNVFPASYGQSLARGGKGNAPYRRGAPTPTKAGRYPVDGYRIHYDAAVSAQVKRDYIRSVAAATSASVARGLGDYYSRQNVRALFRAAVRPYGLRDDDLADITAANLVVLWMTANDAVLPSQVQVRGVARQIRQQIAESGSPVPDAGKRQRVAEALMYQTVTLIRVRETASAQKNTAYLKALAGSAQSLMLPHGVDLWALAMTDTGLEPR